MMDVLLIIASFAILGFVMADAWRKAERRAAQDFAEDWLDTVFVRHHSVPGHRCGLQPTCPGATNIRKS